MKIFILNPPYVKDFCRSARWAAKSRGRVQRHPDYLLTLAGLLLQKGHEVKFVDGPVLDLNREIIKKYLKDFTPDLVVIHTTTPSIYNDLEYAKNAKEISDSIITIAVGPHVSALPKDTFEIAQNRFNNSLDAIAIGEYDFSIAELSDNPSNINNISGIATIIDGKLNYKKAPLCDVNLLPEPAWNLIKPENYYDAGKRFPFLTLINARGCVGNCSFCCYHNVISPGKLRQRNVDLVISEMEHDLSLFPQIKEIMFETDTFATDSLYTENLCKAIIKSRIHKKISWSCNLRVDTKLELLPLMKEAGCRMLMTGFEFGTQEALNSIRKGTTLKQAKQYAETANKLGFILHGCFMIGAPGETIESAKETIRFAKSLPCDTVQFSGLCPYPGTPLYDWAVKNNYLIAKDWTQWLNKDFEQCTLLNYPQFSSKAIDYYIDRGLKSFYLRPLQILRMILNMRRFSDVQRKLFGFKSFLDYFKVKNNVGK